MLAINYITRCVCTFLAIGGLATCVVVENHLSGDGFAIGVFGSLLAMTFAWMIDAKKSKVGYKHLLLQAVSWAVGYSAFFVAYPYVVTLVEAFGERVYLLAFALVVLTMVVFNKHIDAAEKRGELIA